MFLDKSRIKSKFSSSRVKFQAQEPSFKSKNQVLSSRTKRGQRAQQVFMYKVFNETLLTDMGRTKVRKYLKTTDAEAVWKEYSEYMTSASKGASVLSKSSRKCTVTGIDQHQINGLDIVQCTVLVNTNHGYVDLIMNEYAYYGKGHTIHSAGQIEWHKNLVDDKSVKVGGKQYITTLDGYAFPLKCTGGLMYRSIIGKSTDEELVKYPSAHLTSIHEWDPSVFDYSHPEGDGEPIWACDPQHIDLIDPNFDTCGLYTKRAINTLSSLADMQHKSPMALSPPKSTLKPTSMM